MSRSYKLKLEVEIPISDELEEKLSDQGDLIGYLVKRLKEQALNFNGDVVVVTPDGKEIWREKG